MVLSPVLTRLTHLKLDDWCQKITDAGVTALAGGLNALTSLDLAGCSKLTNAGVITLTRLTALDDLSLADCENMTDEGVTALARSLTSLTRLDLCSCCKLTDAGMTALAPLIALSHPCGQVVAEDYVGAMSYSPLHRPDVTILDAGGFGVHTLVELTVFRATAAAKVRSSTRMGPGGRLVHGTIGAALAACSAGDAEGRLR
jgi:hypothetical protein